ncbi:MAG: isocitrate/isopropylmalate dehydrogenase family protein [Cellulomonas sp.]|nr:isocitrate/isopropylmalate dehydrogenase family protein [Cellulomonas sp.]
MHLVTLIPGNGIGPEITKAVTDIFVAAQVPVQWEEQNAGQTTFDQSGELIPTALLKSLEKNKVGLKGPITTPVGKGFRSINITLRQKYDLYQNVRPSKTTPGIKSRYEGIDLVLFRENTEGLYSGIGERTEDRATDLRVITRRASERVITKAFEIARDRNRMKKVTCIVKHNVLVGCRLFLDVFREVAARFPDITQDVAIVDSFAMFVLTQPEKYDVCVTTNMFGDILTDLASVLQGGMGMAVGCNVGDDHAMFEPIHGSAPPLAGKDKANPMAMMLATGEAFFWLGRRHADPRLLAAHAAVEAAVAELVLRGEPLTSDLGGTAGSRAVADAIRAGVRAHLAIST